ncbi:hypothetical protein BB561_005025 [Smittium simulii]|uniref:protein kinase C n=1 Tax=Smittium simulii TaxID=133385 RepID=A0A2T9YCM4_9FUNG|nr:hypothetical protein BB561_005025 [Smittium simulii]
MNNSHADLESAINETKRKLWNEEMILNGAKSMRTQHTNLHVIAELDLQLMESKKRIEYLQNQLKELTLKQFNKTRLQNNSLEPNPDLRKSQALAQNQLQENFSRMELSKTSSALSTQKVSLKIHDIAYKLEVEKKLCEATNRMAFIYTNDYLKGNKKKMAQVTEATQVLTESKAKIRLLEQAFKRYQSLYVDYVDEEETPFEDQSNQQYQIGLSRPLSGKLYLKIVSGKFLHRAPTRLKDIIPETFVQVKINGSVKATTKLSKNATWNENFEINVSKAHEIEFCFYERVEHDVLVGITWIKLFDICEELRKKPTSDSANNGWASADQIENKTSKTYDIKSISPSQSTAVNQPNVHSDRTDIFMEGLRGEWDVEPNGSLQLCVNFVRDKNNRRFIEGLGRKAAVRKRRGPCMEIHSHYFYQIHTYTISKCAICEEYLVNSAAQQCDGCSLFVHDKCLAKVVTRCFVGAGTIKTDSESIDPNDIIKYRIPHRWELTTSLGANWCCHCGTMISFGRKVYKCTECGATCHSNCSTFVPNYCGMKLIRSYEILSRIMQNNLVKPKLVNSRGTIMQNKIKESHLDKSSSPLEDLVNINTDRSKSTITVDASISQKVNTYTKDRYESPPSSNSNTKNQRASSNDQYMVAIPNQNIQPAVKPSKEIEYPVSQNTLNNSIDSSLTQRINSPIAPTKAYGPKDFKFLAVLGKGNFGKVMLAEEKETKMLYALKVLKKQFIAENDEFESMRSEKRVLLIANKDRHPFLVGLHSCFQTSSRIFFVMEYIAGGDLMIHIQRQQFSERRAKFYACEVLLGLEYFHKNSIVYRDLKLDNIMLGADGHIKIADYGLCKEHMPYGATTHTFCGTPEFMAPEIVLEQRYGKAVDWWAFGVLIYEMLLGQSPFRGEGEEEIFDSILEDEVLYPVNMSRDSVSICQELLERDPNKRLGAGVNDADDVKRHPFFKGVNWADFMSKKVTPPFIPQISGNRDISNFDVEFTSEKPNLTITHHKIGSSDQKEFSDFDYTSPWAGKSDKWTL